MSRTNRSAMQIGCPECGANVAATVPPGPGIVDDEPNRLRGSKASCGNCGHELEFYYY